jgi:hypothetical protein
MKVLVDTNVILDVLLHRTAFFYNSHEIFVLAFDGAWRHMRFHLRLIVILPFSCYI